MKRKNTVLQSLIHRLLNQSKEDNIPLWKAVAEYLSKPARNQPQKNIVELDKQGSEDEILVVPGKVLGIGRTSKSLTVVAYKFSNSAKKHLEENGQTMTIEEALDEYPKAKNMRLLA